MKSISLVVVLGLSLVLWSQENKESNTKFRIESIEVGTSNFWSQTPGLSFEEMNLVVPEHDFSMMDFEGFSKNQSCCGFQHSSVNLGLNLGLKKGATDGFLGSPILRLGMSYNSGFQSSVRFEKRESFTFDTIYVTFQGETKPYPMDSVKSDSYTFLASSDRLRLNASVMWHTNPENRWQFYTGAGFGVGFGFNSQIAIQRWLQNDVIQEGQDGSPSLGLNFSDVTIEETIYQAKNPFDFNLFAPFGVDFKLAKGTKKLSRLHAFIDVVPTVWFSQYSGLRMKVNPGVFGTAGLRLHI